jgi:hypothetical protein
MGPAADMHSMGDRLDKISNNIASVYAKKAGGTDASWRGLMLAETWYSDEEAVAAGLADEIEGDPSTRPDRERVRPVGLQERRPHPRPGAAASGTRRRPSTRTPSAMVSVSAGSARTATA